MEEILASIRRIIAEDASGSRPVPPIPSSPSRSNGAPAPASPLQRGFMSREAFLRSSQSPEEVNQRYFTPVTPQDPEPAVETKAKPVAEKKAEKTPAPSPRLKEEPPAEATPAPVVAEPSKPIEAKPAEAIAADVVEEVEVQAVADEVGPKLLAPPEAKSEAAIIDAQLVELLGEDLKALREAESNKIESESASEAADTKPAAPIEKPSPESLQKPLQPEPRPSVTSEPAGPIGQTSEPIDSNDPFSFDLGPSPFLSRSPADHPVERQIRGEPAPAPATAPDRPINGSANGSATPTERGWQKFNGTAGSSVFARPSAPVSIPHEPVPSATQRPSAPFAVPSVSATLGPHRRLEPLSQSFNPEPADRHSHAGFPHVEAEPQSDYVRSAAAPGNVHHDQLETVLHPSPSADGAAGGDRKMEDAVADLLRPLLKTWLAENMPKIVERALRREMTERLLPGQKNSRD
jgi:cell pole-organizing protein PopZ